MIKQGELLQSGKRKSTVRRFTSLLLTICMVLTMLPMVAIADGGLYAVPSETQFVMNGNPVSVTQAYNVDGTNYLQLRAIAAMLNGTAAQFDVGWDGTYAVIEPGKPYSGTVTETTLQGTTDIRISNTKFKMDGNVFTFENAKLINGDTNYLQLREFARKMGGTASRFNVYWDSAAGHAVIAPGAVYTGKAPGEANYNDEDVTWIGDESEFQKTLKALFDTGLRKVPVGDLLPNGSLTNVKYGLVDCDGAFAAQPIYDEIEAKYFKIEESEESCERIFIDGYVQATRGGKMGLLNNKGKEVIPCEYDGVGLPVEGICRLIRKENGVNYLGYWNLEQGREIVAPNKYIIDDAYADAEGDMSPWFERRTAGTNRYASDFDFNGGYALVPSGRREEVTQVLVTGASSDKYASLMYAQIIDKNGDEILSGGPYPYRESFMTNSPYPQKGPYMVYQQLSTKRIHMITDHDDEVIFGSHLESGIVGPQGIIIPAQYHGGIWGYASKWYPNDASIVLLPELSMAITYKCGYEGIKESAAKIGVINFNNQEVIPFDNEYPADSYDPVNNVFYGYALYKTDGTKIPNTEFSADVVNGYYDLKDGDGNYIGVGSVKTGETYTHENLHSTVVNSGKSETRSHVSVNGTIWIKKDKWGLVNLQGSVLLPFDYDEAYTSDEWTISNGGYTIAGKNGRIGMFDTMGNELLPCNYKSIDYAAKGYLQLTDYDTGKHGLYSLYSGKVTIPCVYTNSISMSFERSVTGVITGAALIQIGNSMNALIDVETGKQITPAYLSMSSAGRGLFYSSSSDLYGPDGKIVFPRSENITLYNGKQTGTGEDLTIVVRDGKVGYINSSRLAREGKGLPTTPRVKPVPVPATAKAYLVQPPDKRIYMIGESYDITGLIVHYQDENGVRSIIDNSQLRFFTSGTVELTQGRPFTTEGVKTVEVRYNGNKVDTFDVKVAGESASDALDSGDYYMQILGKYLYPVWVDSQRTYYLELMDKKPDMPYTVKLVNYSDDKGPEYTIAYDGTYIGQPSSSDGAQLKSSNIPHRWRINKYSAFCTIRDYGKQSLLVNAKGEKSDNGTPVIVWSTKGSAPDHAKIKFINAGN